MLSLAEGKKLLAFSVILPCEDTGKRFAQYVPYLLVKMMLMMMPFLFYHLLGSINATILTKAASSNNIENTIETKFEYILVLQYDCKVQIMYHEFECILAHTFEFQVKVIIH